jgi:hypothetical protein
MANVSNDSCYAPPPDAGHALAVSAGQAEEPVTAEIVAPPPSPWRFGMKALLALMAVCSVQFAMMSYAGVLAGLLIGVAVCFGAFTILTIVGIVLSGRSARLLSHFDQILVRLMVALVILAFGTIIAGGGTAAYETVARRYRHSAVERELGVSLSEVMLTSNNTAVWGLKVTGVRSGSIADLAGLRSGEVIVVEGRIQEFYDLVETNRGKQIDVNVATGLVTQSLQNCPQRSVTLAVPK